RCRKTRELLPKGAELGELDRNQRVARQRQPPDGQTAALGEACKLVTEYQRELRAIARPLLFAEYVGRQARRVPLRHGLEALRSTQQEVRRLDHGRQPSAQRIAGRVFGAEMILDEIDADLFARAPQMLRQKQGKRVVALAHDVDVVGQVVRTAYAANGHDFQLGSVLRKLGAEWQVAAP